MNLVPATESKAKKKIQTLQRVLKTGYSGKYDILNTIFYIRPPKIFYFRPKNRDFIFEEFFFSFVPFIKIKLLLISFIGKLIPKISQFKILKEFKKRINKILTFNQITLKW